MGGSDRLQPGGSHRPSGGRLWDRPDLARWLIRSDPEVQARRCLEIIGEALAQAGAEISDVIRTRIYLTSAEDAEAVGRAHAAVFGAVRPASTMVVVAGLLDPRWRVEIEAEALRA